MNVKELIKLFQPQRLTYFLNRVAENQANQH